MRILAISPHADDIELAAGGTLAKLKDEGHIIGIVYFALCGIEKEQKKANRKLFGSLVGKTHISFTNLPNKYLYESRQNILNILIYERDTFKPDLVIGPNPKSLHQDHKTVGEEMVRCFKKCSVIAYMHPWDSCNENNNLAVDISNIKYFMKKMVMLDCFESQKDKPYFNGRLIIHQLTANGFRFGIDGEAEVFEVIRWKI